MQFNVCSAFSFDATYVLHILNFLPQENVSERNQALLFSVNEKTNNYLILLSLSHCLIALYRKHCTDAPFNIIKHYREMLKTFLQLAKMALCKFKECLAVVY